VDGARTTLGLHDDFMVLFTRLRVILVTVRSLVTQCFAQDQSIFQDTLRDILFRLGLERRH